MGGNGDASAYSANSLINRLPVREANAVLSRGMLLTLSSCQKLDTAEPTSPQVCFFEEGLAGLTSGDAGGEFFLNANVGREGMFGSSLALGSALHPLKAEMVVEGKAVCLSSHAFCELLKDCPKLRELTLQHALVTMSKLAVAAACRLSHSAEQRVASLLINIFDNVETNWAEIK